MTVPRGAAVLRERLLGPALLYRQVMSRWEHCWQRGAPPLQRTLRRRQASQARVDRRAALLPLEDAVLEAAAAMAAGESLLAIGTGKGGGSSGPFMLKCCSGGVGHAEFREVGVVEAAERQKKQRMGSGVLSELHG